MLESKADTYSKLISCSRSTGFIRLPSERTLRDYTHVLKNKAGFLSEINLTQHDESRGEEILWHHLDEMNIKENLVYDNFIGDVVYLCMYNNYITIIGLYIKCETQVQCRRLVQSCCHSFNATAIYLCTCANPRACHMQLLYSVVAVWLFKSCVQRTMSGNQPQKKQRLFFLVPMENVEEILQSCKSQVVADLKQLDEKLKKRLEWSDVKLLRSFLVFLETQSWLASSSDDTLVELREAVYISHHLFS